jgi:hypothetical protein
MNIEQNGVKWEECGAARPTGARHVGSDGLKRLVGAAVNADTMPGARPRTPLVADMLFPSSWTQPPIPAGRHGLNHGERADGGGFPGGAMHRLMHGTVGGAMHRLMTPWSHLGRAWGFTQALVTSTSPAARPRGQTAAVGVPLP